MSFIIISYGFLGAFLASLPILAFTYFFLQKQLRNRYCLPPGPLPFPIIGTLHLLGPLPHQSFASLAKSYGPLMHLRLGSIHVLVVSSASVAREILSIHDRTFASRPLLEAGCLFYDHLNVGFSPYGQRWRRMRRVYTLNLFNMKKINSFQHIREEEMSSMLRSILQVSQEGKAVNLRAFVSTLATNTMMRIVMSRRFSTEESQKSSELRYILEETFRLSGVPVISDFVPWLHWLDWKGIIKKMKEVNKSVDVFLEQVINERRKCRKENPSQPNGDLLDTLLSIADDKSAEISEEAMKASILELLGAGTDTSSVTIEWAMAEMIRNPFILHKLQEEIESHVPLSRKVELSDLPNLHYLEAVVKETFRLHPAAPLLIPRYSTESCEVAGYTIPEKTRLFLNVWAIGRDEASWERPLHFWPERFIGSSIDVRGKDFELLPFGAGRRICPGMPLGLSMVQFSIASLVHSFQWSLPDAKDVQDLDMREEMGITVHMAKPLFLHATQRGIIS